MSGSCSHCGAVFKTGLLGYNAALSEREIELVNIAHSLELAAGCMKCAGPLHDTAVAKLNDTIEELKKDAGAGLSIIPMASISSPIDWRYDTLGIVTAQTVSGTGLFSDVTSAFTDLFGAQSGAYNQKLRSAENSCRASLRAQTLHCGGNAILGVDVDYAEVGGTRAMLMVCMTGTAVRVLNTEVLGSGYVANRADLDDKLGRLRRLTTFQENRYAIS